MAAERNVDIRIGDGRGHTRFHALWIGKAYKHSFVKRHYQILPGKQSIKARHYYHRV